MNRLALPLRYRIAVIVFLLEAVMITAVLWQTLGASAEALRRHAEEEAAILLRLLAYESHASLVEESYAGLQEHFRVLAKEPLITTLMLTDHQGTIVASTRPAALGTRLPPRTANTTDEWRTRELRQYGSVLGILHVQVSHDALDALTAQIRLRGVLIGLVGMVVILVVGILAGYLLTRRLEHLQHAARLLAAGDFGARANLSGRDEVAAVGHAMDALADRVENELAGRQQAVAALAESEALLTLMADSLPVLLSYIDVNEVYRFSNAQHRLWHAREAAEIVGRRVDEVLPPEAYARLRPDLLRALAGERMEFLRTVTYADGVQRNLHVIYVPHIGPDGAVRGVSSMAEDVTERNQAESALRESESLLRLMTDSVPVLLSYIDNDLRVRLSNRTHAAWMNRPREEVVGHRVDDLMPPESMSALRPAFSQVLAGERVEIQRALVYPDGRAREINIVYVPDIAEDGTVRGFSSMAEDVTERNQQARLIAESAARLRLLTDAVPVAITHLDANLRYQFANREYAGWLGHTPDELQGLTVEAVLPRDTYRVMLPELRRGLAGERVEFERRAAYPDGKMRDVRVVYVPDVGPDGTVRGLSAMVEDLTERKRAERAVLESEAQLRLFVDSAPLLISYVDSDLRFQLANEALARWMATTPEAMLGRPVREILAPEGYAVLRPYMERAVAGEPVELETPVRYPTGETREMRVIYVPHRADNGQVLGYFSIAEDISERKQAESALRESEARFRTVVANAPVIIWSLDAEGRFTLSEGKGLEALGLQPGELVGASVTEVYADFPGILADTRRVLHGEAFSNVQQVGDVSFEVSYTPMTDTGGRVTGMIGVATDVTDREQAMAALRESEERFRVVAENTPVPVMVTTPDTAFHLYDNRAANEFFLGKPEGLRGQEGLKLWVDVNERWEMARRVQDHGALVNYETRVWGHGGQVRWVIATTAQVQFDGQPALLTSFHDITERREAEERLRYHEALLQAIFDALPVWVSVKDKDLRYLMVNQASLDDSGLTREDYIGVHTHDLPFGSREEMRRNAEFDQKVLDSGERFVVTEQEQRLPNGRLVYVDHYKVPIADANGARAGIVTVSVDVTERRAAEQEIRRGRALLQAVFDVLPAWVFVKDKDSRFLMANPEMAQDLGTTVEALAGLANEDIPNGDRQRRRMIRAEDLSVLNTGERYMQDEPFQLPNGRKTMRTVIKAPLRDEKGEIVGIVGVALDITARTEAETRLKELNENLELRVQERTAELEAAQAELVRREKMATLGQLTATVSHELRNPLGTIQTSAYTLRERLDVTALGVDRVLDRIQRNVVRCDNIIRDLLDYSRNREPAPQQTDVDAWIESILSEQSVPVSVGVSLGLDTGGRTVPIDVDYLRRAFINVFENAVQALDAWTPPDGESRRVTISTRLEADRLCIVVADNGPGMTPEVLGKVFEPLFSTKTYGVGLGLPTVRQIMRQNGGDIRLTSHCEGPERGTRVELWLVLSGKVALSA